jgi:hypothetical protein
MMFFAYDYLIPMGTAVPNYKKPASLLSAGPALHSAAMSSLAGKLFPRPLRLDLIQDAEDLRLV